jgi:hypothetical protein
VDIKTVVDNPEWQELRQSMVGTWKTSPAQNVKRLRRYLYNGNRKPDILRHRRVYNYLTGSGFRIGIIQHKAIDKFLAELRKTKPMSKRG